MGVVIWGLGNECKRYLEKYPKLKDYILAFTDNAERYWGKLFYEVEVISPQELANLQYEKLIIATKEYEKEVWTQCVEKMHIDPNKIINIRTYVKNGIVQGKLYSDFIRIEASSLCQLQCTSCYMRKGIDTVGRGFLKFEDFKRLIDDNPYIRHVELSNNGEVFLNPQLKDILEYAYLKNVVVDMTGGVNFNAVNEEVLESLVKFQVKSIVVAIDGVTQDIYSIYRQNGNIDAVFDNIRKVNQYKEKYDSQFPRMKWQYVLMSHNEHQAELAKEMASKLNMDIFFKLTWDPGYVPKDPEKLKRITGLKHLSREEYLQSTDKLYQSNICKQLFLEPQINWDGRLLGCCSNYLNDFKVNVFQDGGFETALSSEYYVNAKQMLIGEKVPKILDTACVKCSMFQKMKEEGNYFLLDEIL